MKSVSVKHRILNIAAFLISLLTFLTTIWIVLPAPSYYIWLFSVLASEWSLAFGFVALLGIICALFADKSGLRMISFLLSLTALIISFYPFISAYRIAQTQNVSLSWSEYFSGFYKNDSQINFTTRAFAVVDGKELKTDIYLPAAESDKKRTGIIVVHGGSWSGGVRNDFPQWDRWLAQNGYTVFDIDYRLTQPNWQTATGDVKCAVNWVQQHAADFDISPDKVVLLGRSAGAHLALLAADSQNDERIPASCTGDSQNKIRAVISFYAPTDLIWDYENPANQRVIDGHLTLRSLMGGNPSDSVEMRDKYLLASPTNHTSPNVPPTLLVHGGHDQLVLPQNMDFIAEKLQANGVVNHEIFIPYAQHGFDFNFKGWGSQIVKPKILEFLNDSLR